MSRPRSEHPSPHDLISTLNVLGVYFLTSGERPPEVVVPPTRLLAALVEQKDARLRLATVPLLRVSGSDSAASSFAEERNG